MANPKATLAQARADARGGRGSEAVSDYDYDEMNRLVQLAVFDDDDGSGTDWIQTKQKISWPNTVTTFCWTAIAKK